MRSCLAAEMEEVLEPLGSDEGRPRALALEQRVRGDCRAVREALELAGTDGSGRSQHGLLLARRGRHLRRRDPALVDEDGVRESAANVDAENAHLANVRGTKRVRRDMTELKLVGAGGEPVDLRRTIASHGVADLPPNRIDEDAWTLELTLPVDGKAPRTVVVSEGRPGYAKVEVRGRKPSAADLDRLRSQCRAHPPARRGPDAVLRGRCEGSRPRLGDCRRRPPPSQPDGVRGRREDDLHDELHLVCDRAHGQRARREPRRARRRR